MQLSEEQLSELSKDYTNYKWQYGEAICENDLRYLYIELNLSRDEISSILNSSIRKIYRHLKLYNIKKSREQIIELSKRKNLELYGNEFPSRLQEFKDKQQNTCMEKYGTKSYFQTEECRHKTEQTNIEKYEVVHPMKCPQILDKIKQTCTQKYGVENYFQSEEFKQKSQKTLKEKFGDKPYSNKQIRDKYKNTCLDKYGVDNGFKSDEVKQKIKETITTKYGAKTYCESSFYDKDKEMDKRKQTNIERYGIDHPLKLEEFKQLQKQSLIDKYGVDNAIKLDSVQKARLDNLNEITEKAYNTKKKNNSFNTSNAELIIFKALNELFPNNVLTQYKSDVYPFACDFYLPQLDLYIEYQGFWTHGKEPFNPSNSEHQKLIEHWRKKANELNFKKEHKKLYENAIQVWTKKDPYKRQIAKDNNLNWVEFFNLQQFDNWCKNLSINIERRNII